MVLTGGALKNSKASFTQEEGFCVFEQSVHTGPFPDASER